jgi:tRNA-splicing ligase RtcB (3'-phosphate/5'-hydroxy nucleic acid ligase)
LQPRRGPRHEPHKAKKLFTVADHIKATESVEGRKDKDVIDEIPTAYKDMRRTVSCSCGLTQKIAKADAQD